MWLPYRVRSLQAPRSAERSVCTVGRPRPRTLQRVERCRQETREIAVGTGSCGLSAGDMS